MTDVDLHMHTHYSDGQASPEGLLRAAAARGLKAISITDHETTLGNREGQGLAAQYGVELVPGIEITTYWDGYTGHGDGPDVDLLGYFIDLESEHLRATEARLYESIVARADRSVAALCELGFEITLDEVLAMHKTYPGYMPIMNTLKHVGYSAEDAARGVARVWNPAGPAAVSIEEGIQMIHDAGGVAVLAHPSIIRRQTDSEPLSERGLMDLKAMGLDAVEVYHYRLDRRQRQYFEMLAKMFDLPVSGGSDTHSSAEASRRFGTEPVTLEMLEILREKATAYK